ncbi:MAG TPA: hypothetical protein VMT85_17660 [Thermoanaerobaculia bacterium]|nr:hypothetical protein [Thermoanaerobaculia bacterium]
MLSSGRVVYGTAIVGFGALCLRYVGFVHQLQPVDVFVSAATPGYGPLAAQNGVALIACGLALVADLHVHRAALALAVFFTLWILLLQLPSAFLDPGLLRSPFWVRTFEISVLTGAALILAGMTIEPRRDRWTRAGRLLFGSSLPVFGVLHFVYAENVASLVPSFFPWPLFLAYLTGVGNVAAGAAIAAGALPRLAAILAAVMYGIYAVTLHIPRELLAAVPPGDQRAGLTSMFVAIGFCGAALIVAGSLGSAPEPAPGSSTSLARRFLTLRSTRPSHDPRP